jgi:hypothetical protein
MASDIISRLIIGKLAKMSQAKGSAGFQGGAGGWNWPAGRGRGIGRGGVAMTFLREMWEFLRHRKKFWLLPIIVMLVIVGGLFIVAQGSAVAPFIYTLF